MTQTNHEIISARLQALRPEGKYQKQSLEAMKKMYFVDDANQIASTEKSLLLGYDFQSEMLRGEKRLKRVENIESAVVKLERHAYAPEMNCLHFKNGKTLQAEGFTELKTAIKFAAISLSEEQINDYIGAE